MQDCGVVWVATVLWSKMGRSVVGCGRHQFDGGRQAGLRWCIMSGHSVVEKDGQDCSRQ